MNREIINVGCPRCTGVPDRPGLTYGRKEVVELVLENGAWLESQEKRGFTALHLAARNGHRAIVEKLLNAGAEPNAKDNAGTTPMQMVGEKYPDIGRLESYQAQRHDVKAEIACGQ